MPRRVLVLLVRAWQLVVSPWYPPVCRFYPSCSTYAVRALEEHGAVRGTGLAARRLLRCHPWNPGGVDHVPPRDGPRRSPPGRAREDPPGRPAA
ncbi:membrane protein insertion efficiency factor YidD [Pseudokineococcus basanitobsidens]|uniref:Putative membrane protein insertion efficiency factor n=1 Tax=Pseudokineococcus basanitobsidens TaxID=1926649 RepID=A0ABU8RL31_9ACTN